MIGSFDRHARRFGRKRGPRGVWGELDKKVVFSMLGPRGEDEVRGRTDEGGNVRVKNE